MKRFALLATVATLLVSATVPALASDQLALSLGVEGEGYSTAELGQLKGALDDGDRAMVNLIKDRHAEQVAGIDVSRGAMAGAGQIASMLGVAPGDYTSGELAALKGAVEDGDLGLVKLIESHEFGAAAYHPENWAQLAAYLGMDPYTSTAAELTAAFAD